MERRLGTHLRYYVIKIKYTPLLHSIGSKTTRGLPRRSTPALSKRKFNTIPKKSIFRGSCGYAIAQNSAELQREGVLCRFREDNYIEIRSGAPISDGYEDKSHKSVIVSGRVLKRSKVHARQHCISKNNFSEIFHGQSELATARQIRSHNQIMVRDIKRINTILVKLKRHRFHTVANFII